MSATTAAPATTRAKNLALVAMLLAVAMTFIDQTIVAIAAPNIQAELSLSQEGSRWVINAYLLALAATFALGGRLADVLGHRRMATVGIIGFAVTSLLCGLVPANDAAQAWIITFRALQGMAAAVMIPAALAVVVGAFPVRERGRALAIFFGVSGGLTAVGPIAGGVLTQWTWRSIFWINVPIAVLALVLLAAAHIAPSRRRERIDVRGAVLAAIGMGLSVLGFEQAPEWGWGNAGTWLCIGGGLVAIVVFAAVEARTHSPLIQVRIFRDRAFVVDNAVLFLSMIAFVPVFFFASVYAQVSLGYDANSAGLYLLVFFAGFAPAAQVGGRLLDSRGARLPVVLGAAAATAGFALWGTRLTELSLGAQWPFIVLAGAGVGLLLGPASTDAVNRAFGASYGEVTGITQTVRNYGSALGIAVLGTVLSTVFANRLTTSLTDLGVPAATARDIADTASRGGSAGGGGEMPAAMRTVVSHDFAVATQWVLYGMAIALALSFLVALAHPGGRPGAGEHPAEAPPAGA
ncbi:MFS transporter [Amorphoplanes nipponensis]|uniref:MFS transporter n=1 Tax=Actinoplanes nipponensis TaxID=135950 RepID=A0A919JKV5_9ACTN|nr:MFS transporter [Actinoplanes nipponensis]GIE51272.1 MFS transporter [Actinoplanes nipponensis]